MGLPEEMELPPRKELEPCEDWERGTSGLPGCGEMLFPWGTAALLKNPSKPWPQCPLVPMDQGWEQTLIPAGVALV